jgi:hypothetical protein
MQFCQLFLPIIYRRVWQCSLPFAVADALTAEAEALAAEAVRLEAEVLQIVESKIG